MRRKVNELNVEETQSQITVRDQGYFNDMRAELRQK